MQYLLKVLSETVKYFWLAGSVTWPFAFARLHGPTCSTWRTFFRQRWKSLDWLVRSRDRLPPNPVSWWNLWTVCAYMQHLLKVLSETMIYFWLAGSVTWPSAFARLHGTTCSTWRTFFRPTVKEFWLAGLGHATADLAGRANPSMEKRFAIDYRSPRPATRNHRRLPRLALKTTPSIRHAVDADEDEPPLAVGVVDRWLSATSKTR